MKERFLEDYKIYINAPRIPKFVNKEMKARFYDFWQPLKDRIEDEIDNRLYVIGLERNSLLFRELYEKEKETSI